MKQEKKGGKVEQVLEHVVDRWPASMGLPPFFPGAAFPEEPRRAVFHSYFHGRDPFIEGYNAARCGIDFEWRTRRALLRLFSRSRMFP